MSSSEVLDFEKICRLCLSEKRSMSAIFSKKKSDCKVPLSVRIMSCGALQLYEGDGLPASICSKCLANVNQSYAFREQCEQADNTLRQYLQRKNEIADEEEPKIEAELQLETEPEPEMDLETENEPEASTSKDENMGVAENETEDEDDDDVPLSKMTQTKRTALECDICRTKFGSKQMLQEHKSSHINEKGYYVCDICNKEYPRKPSLKKHRLRHSGNPQHLCSECGKCFYFSDLLKDHMLSCMNQRQHTCSMCQNKFNSAYSLKRHLVTHTTETPFDCQNESTDNIDVKLEENTLNTNNIKREEEIRYDPSCFALVVKDKIGKKKKDDLKRKKKKDKELTCDVCKLRFNVEDEKMRHITDKHMNDQGQYFCDFCSKIFKSKAILKDHRKKHLTDPEYLCVRCGKLYYSKGHLTEHNLYCLDEKKFECPICKKRFNVNKQFRRHFIIHEAERYIKCTVCEQTFSRRDNYRQHFRRHTGEKPFTCDICGKSFRIKATYNYHRKTHRVGEPIIRQDSLITFQEPTRTEEYPIFSAPRPNEDFSNKKEEYNTFETCRDVRRDVPGVIPDPYDRKDLTLPGDGFPRRDMMLGIPFQPFRRESEFLEPGLNKDKT